MKQDIQVLETLAFGSKNSYYSGTHFLIAGGCLILLHQEHTEHDTQKIIIKKMPFGVLQWKTGI